MKTSTVALILAAATVIAGGTALAAEKKAPEPGTLEYQAALETGGLPASTPAAAHKKADPRTAQAKTIEVGGVVYRVGIDTD